MERGRKHVQGKKLHYTSYFYNSESKAQQSTLSWGVRGHSLWKIEWDLICLWGEEALRKEAGGVCRRKGNVQRERRLSSQKQENVESQKWGKRIPRSRVVSSIRCLRERPEETSWGRGLRGIWYVERILSKSWITAVWGGWHQRDLAPHRDVIKKSPGGQDTQARVWVTLNWPSTLPSLQRIGPSQLVSVCLLVFWCWGSKLGPWVLYHWAKSQTPGPYQSNQYSSFCLLM